MNTKQTLWASALAAIGASLCCIAPLVLVTLGIGGAWVATLTQLEPLRPLFILATFVLMGLAWRKLYRQSADCESGAPCADVAVQGRQRSIFWLAVVPLLLLLALPWYAPLFY